MTLSIPLCLLGRDEIVQELHGFWGRRELLINAVLGVAAVISLHLIRV